MKIAVLICIHRVDFYSHQSEIFSSQLTCFSDIFHIAHGTALTSEDKNFFHSTVGYNFHFLLNLLHGELHSNFVVAVEATVYAVVFTIIRYIKRSENVNSISKMLAGFKSGSLCHFLKKRFCRRRKKCLEIFEGTCLMLKCCHYILCCILCIVI